ncbi:MAG: phosphate ABC transporter permease PstA [Deltaproteobacteria bacterium]|nr:phosphate ABC transporter permease PstA [Deltaproteobacteria bacterium]
MTDYELTQGSASIGSPPINGVATQSRQVPLESRQWRPRRTRRKYVGYMFLLLTLAATLLGVAALYVLLESVISQGWARLSWDFISNFPSRIASRAGIKAALFGSIYLTGLVAVIAIPVGVGAAVYLEEFAADTKWRRVIDINIANLAGVPSIVYGMLGLMLFVRICAFGHSLLAGACTMSLLILPVIIVTAREALKTVPNGVRLAALGLGATKWQTIRAHVLPTALPGILTGVILSLSRAVGETAPLLMIGALSYMAFVPESPMDDFTVLPIQIFNWSSRPQDEFRVAAAAGILVLLAILLTVNSCAIFMRMRFQRKMQW